VWLAGCLAAATTLSCRADSGVPAPEGAATPAATASLLASPAVPEGASAEEAATILARVQFAALQGMSADGVYATDVTEVQWSNGALGCPEPGKVYPQVMTPGFRIVVSTGTAEMVFHSDKGASGRLPVVVPCPNEAVAGSPELGAPALEKAEVDLRTRLPAGADVAVADSFLAPVTELACDSATPAPPSGAPKKVILEFHLTSGETTHVYRAWGDDILYCGTTDDLILE
jgi:hypothetical protein